MHKYRLIMRQLQSRRDFLKTTSYAASAGMWACASPISALGSTRATYNVALIGTGWYGKSDLFKIIQVADCRVSGLCDVDSKLLYEAQGLVAARSIDGHKPNLYRDYRDLLALEKPDIVLIGTPDHWHALQAIDAMKAGAHVYLQKPISVDVLEGEAVLRAARHYKKVAQIGLQRRSTPHLQWVKKNIVDTGMLGKISHVEMFCYYHMRSSANPPLQEVPDHLDYELWTGPAPWRPYDGLPHRGWWRAFMEYSNGIMGDMCVHMFDAVRWMLGLGWPHTISSTGGIYVQKAAKSNTADTQTAIFQYAELNCVWQHRSWGTAPDPEYPWGFVIYGEGGTLKADVHKSEFIPRGQGGRIRRDVLLEKEEYPEDLTEKDIEIHTAPATRGQMRDMISAIENGTKPISDIEEAYISTASCIIANLSMRLNRPLRYDPLLKIIEGDDEATALLRREYREGYIHPADMRF